MLYHQASCFQTNLALSCLHPQNLPINRGLLNPPSAADLNCRNLSALDEIVNARERNAEVVGRLFYSEQMMIWTLAQSWRLCVQKQSGNNAICRRFVKRSRNVIGCC